MNVFAKSLVLVMLSFLCVSLAKAQRSTKVDQKQGVVVNHVPQKIDAKALYLFYISGYIVEAGNIRPTISNIGFRCFISSPLS